MDRTFRILVLTLLIVFLIGCASVPLITSAGNVVFTNAMLPQSCRLVGQVSSKDPNGLINTHTSHANLQIMKINSLKKQAVSFGANVVVLTDHQTTYMQQRFSSQRAATVTLIDTQSLAGKAYACPSSILSILPNLNSVTILEANEGN